MFVLLIPAMISIIFPIMQDRLQSNFRKIALAPHDFSGNF